MRWRPLYGTGARQSGSRDNLQGGPLLVVDVSGLSHISEHEVVHGYRCDLPRRIADRLGRADQERALFVGLTFFDDVLVRGKVSCVAARSGDAPMRLQ